MALDLGKQIGPMPLGAWVAVVGGGLGIAVYTKRQMPTAAAVVPVTDTSGTPGVGTGGSGMWEPVGPSTSGPTDAPITDNDSWAKAAISYLIANGDDPNVSDSAIRKYIGGTQQTPQEYALTGIALGHLGPPPTPLPPSEYGPPVIAPTVPTVDPAAYQHQKDLVNYYGNLASKEYPAFLASLMPKPAVAVLQPPPAPLPAGRTYTVVSGDTLWGIASRYYHNGALWPQIYNANRGKISNPNLIHPGQVLIIP